MSGHGQQGMPWFRTADLSPVEGHVAQESFALAGPEANQHRCENVTGLTNGIDFFGPTDATLATFGKRKRLLGQDDRDGALDLVRLDDKSVSLNFSHQVADSLSGTTQRSRKRPSQYKVTKPRPVTTFAEPSEASDWKWLGDKSWPCRDQRVHIVKHNEIFLHDHDPRSPYSELCDVSRSKLDLDPQKAQKDVPATGGGAEQSMRNLPASEREPDHRLSDLKWPFGDLTWSHETFRAPDGDTSKPGSTGSQGFPHFVTAGPIVPLSGSDLFGYDRDHLLGNILWA